MNSHEGVRISSIKAEHNLVRVVSDNCAFSKDLSLRKDGKLNETSFKHLLVGKGNSKNFSPVLSQLKFTLEWMEVFVY